MSSLRAFVRPLAVALSLAFAAAPASALADPARPAPAEAKGGKAEGKDHGKQHRKDRGEGAREGHRRFPIDARKFQDRIGKRIVKSREHLERALTNPKVSDAVKAKIRKDFEASAAEVEAAAKRAGADGSVTKEEAKQVRDVAKALRQKVREGHGRGGKKGKGNA